MSTLSTQALSATTRPSGSPPLLRRACACGGTPGPTGECEACRKKRLGLQRFAASTGPAVAPPIVHDVLRSPGRPLDPATRAEMEPRFGHSFADVRVHADGRAARSAEAVAARAYTVGHDVVFAAGRYAPASAEGRGLLAHELAHVVQQRDASAVVPARLEVGPVDAPEEREAERAAEAVLHGGAAALPGSGVQRVARAETHPPAATTEPQETAVVAKGDAKATSLTQYAMLVRFAEKALGFSPRKMLSLLRQLYYSSESWSVCKGTACSFWEDVIRCGVSLEDPRPKLGEALYRVLANSQVVEGVDVGHLFTGMEAMQCPQNRVMLKVVEATVSVPDMPNQEFATWGGDLSSAVAQRVVDEAASGTTGAWSTYFGASQTLAGVEDMAGNIDSYVISRGLAKDANCASASVAGKVPKLSSPISQILLEYYSATASGSTRRDNRIPCFVRAIGGTVSEGKITNKSALGKRIAPRVAGLASIFYLSKAPKVKTALETSVPVLGTQKMITVSGKLTKYSAEITVLFVNWLEDQL